MSAKGNHFEPAKLQIFPFIDVLLCTLGSLIIILIVISWQVRAQALETHRQQKEQVKKESPDDAELKLAREGLDWQIEQLADARTKTGAELEANRLTLSNLEDQIRKL